MIYRRLGRSGLRVSVVGIGAWQFGGEWGRAFSVAEVASILDRAAELGVNLVDTAECYGDHVSERLIGQALSGKRERWLIATKFGHRWTGHLARADRWQPAQVRQQLEASLRALQTEFIDLYQFHSGGNAVFENDELWAMLDEQVRLGKVRHLGVSVSSKGDPMPQIERATVVGASVIQIVYNRLERGPEAAALPTCQAHDLGVLARVPLASGLLSGKYRPGTQFTQPDDMRSSLADDRVQAQLAEVERIRREEVPVGVEMAAWALAWCLRHPAVSSVIPGCKSVAQVEANASVIALVGDSCKP
jgi:aryl-alcohol dehydrogenase-like predicted oxidoreductase